MADNLLQKYKNTLSVNTELSSLYTKDEEFKFTGPTANLTRKTYDQPTANYILAYNNIGSVFEASLEEPIGQGKVNLMFLPRNTRKYKELAVGDIAMVKMVGAPQVIQSGGLGVPIKIQQSVSFVPKMLQEKFLLGNDLDTYMGIYADSNARDVYAFKYQAAVFALLSPIVALVLDSSGWQKVLATAALKHDFVPRPGHDESTFQGFVSVRTELAKKLYNEFGKQVTNINRVDLKTMIIRTKEHFHFDATNGLQENLNEEYDASLTKIKNSLKSSKFLAYLNEEEKNVMEEALSIAETLVAQTRFLELMARECVFAVGDHTKHSGWKGNLYKDEVFTTQEENKKRPKKENLYTPTSSDFPAYSNKQFHERSYHPARVENPLDLVLIVGRDYWESLTAAAGKDGVFGADLFSKVDTLTLLSRIGSLISLPEMPANVARLVDRKAIQFRRFLRVEGEDELVQPLTRAKTLHMWDFWKYDDNRVDVIYIFTQGTYGRLTQRLYLREPAN